MPFTNKQVLQPGRKINLPGLGELRLKEKLKFTCASQTFTIGRQANRWFVSFTLDVERVPPLFHQVVEPTGIDLGVKSFATLSDGTIIYGTTVEVVDRWFASSKTCSSCGCAKEKLSLSERIFNCLNCGKVIERDLNAALNLAKYVPGATGKLMPVDEKEPTPSATSVKTRSRK